MNFIACGVAFGCALRYLFGVVRSILLQGRRLGNPGGPIILWAPKVVNAGFLWRSCAPEDGAPGILHDFWSRFIISEWYFSHSTGYSAGTQLFVPYRRPKLWFFGFSKILRFDSCYEISGCLDSSFPCDFNFFWWFQIWFSWFLWNFEIWQFRWKTEAGGRFDHQIPCNFFAGANFIALRRRIRSCKFLFNMVRSTLLWGGA